MAKYLAGGCYKCDFSEGQSTHFCEKGFCNNYEPSLIKVPDDYPFGLTMEDFNKNYGTNYTD